MLNYLLPSMIPLVMINLFEVKEIFFPYLEEIKELVEVVEVAVVTLVVVIMVVVVVVVVVAGGYFPKVQLIFQGVQ